MPPLENPAHERFVLEYVQSGNATRAYKIAFGRENDSSARSEASRLLSTNPSIERRLDEIMEANAERAVEQLAITTAGQIAKLEKIIERSQIDKQHSASVSAVVAQSKLAGIWVEQADIRNMNVQYVISDRPKTSAEWAKRFCGED